MYNRVLFLIVLLGGILFVNPSYSGDLSSSAFIPSTDDTRFSEQIKTPTLGISSSPSIFRSNWIHGVSGNRLLFLTAQSTWLQNLLLQNTQIDDTITKKKEPDVIYVPTPQKVVEKMLELAQVQKKDLLYDLGCGDGRIVVTAAKKYGCKAVGFDIDPERIQEATENVKKNRMEELVEIKQKDIFELDLKEANVITLYLLETLNVKLIPQLNKMKPGSRIVSHQFAMGDIKPDREITVHVGEEDDIGHKVYLWTTPLKAKK